MFKKMHNDAHTLFQKKNSQAVRNFGTKSVPHVIKEVFTGYTNDNKEKKSNLEK